LLAVTLAGCGSIDLAESWQLDRLRILAVQAEPAEPRPGDTVQFRALTWVPADQALSLTVWFACLPGGATDYGCTVDPTALGDLTSADLSTMSAEEQAALFQKLLDAGLIGAEPYLSPTWTAPADALDGLADQARLEGVDAIVNLTAIPEGTTSESELEIAFKRIPISEAATPNHNPELTGFLVDELPVAPDGTVEVLWGQQVHIEPLLSEDSIETYTFRNDAGEDESRTEEPYLTWYTEAGEYDQPYSLYPNLDVAWTAPAPSRTGSVPYLATLEERTVQLITVCRDRRGGMAWGQLNVHLHGLTLPGG